MSRSKSHFAIYWIKCFDIIGETVWAQWQWLSVMHSLHCALRYEKRELWATTAARTRVLRYSTPTSDCLLVLSILRRLRECTEHTFFFWLQPVVVAANLTQTYQQTVLVAEWNIHCSPCSALVITIIIIVYYYTLSMSSWAVDKSRACEVEKCHRISSSFRFISRDLIDKALQSTRFLSSTRDPAVCGLLPTRLIHSWIILLIFLAVRSPVSDG